MPVNFFSKKQASQFFQHINIYILFKGQRYKYLLLLYR